MYIPPNGVGFLRCYLLYLRLYIVIKYRLVYGSDLVQCSLFWYILRGTYIHTHIRRYVRMCST